MESLRKIYAVVMCWLQLRIKNAKEALANMEDQMNARVLSHPHELWMMMELQPTGWKGRLRTDRPNIFFLDLNGVWKKLIVRWDGKAWYVNDDCYFFEEEWEEEAALGISKPPA